MTMALSNMTQGAPGNVLDIAGKNGAKQAVSATGLEALTAETIVAGDTPTKKGVSFAALVQSIARNVLPATRKADPGIDAAAPETSGSTDKPDNPVALLAMALHAEKHADLSISTDAKAAPKAKAPELSQALKADGPDIPVISSEISVPATPDPAEQPHEGKHLGKRIHELKQRMIAGNDYVLPIEAKSAPETVAPSGKVEPVDEKLQPDAVVTDKPDQATPLIAATPQAAAPVSAPLVVQDKSPERSADNSKTAPVVSEKRAVTTGGLRDAPAMETVPLIATENKNKRNTVPESVKSGEEISPVKAQFDSEITEINVKKIKDNFEKKLPDIVPDSESPATRPKSAARSLPDAVAKGDNAPKTAAADIQSARIELAPAARADAPVRDVQQPQPQVHTAPAAQPATITTNLTGALSSQVVDMGVSGQWIDDIARQIASIGANPGHGSFRIESQALGAVRVDLAPSAQGIGSDVLMRVNNDEAFAALDKDRDRLVQDARMASVRINEVRIDRLAPAQDSQGSGSATSQQQGNGAGQQAMNQNYTQTGGQMDNRGGQQPGRQDTAAMGDQRNGQNSPKAPFTNAVMNGVERDDASRSSRSGRGDTARYA